MQKRIAIVGTGALGGYIGGNLAHHGHDVTFIDMWPANLAAIATRGLELDGVTAEEKFTVKSAMTLHRKWSVRRSRYPVVQPWRWHPPDRPSRPRR